MKMERFLQFGLNQEGKKRKLGPHDRLGSVLRSGEEYIFSISRDIIDRNGIPMKEDYFRRLQIVAADRELPRFDKWEIIPPDAMDNHNKLEIRFDESLDFGSMMNSFNITNVQGVFMDGNWKVGDGERSIFFYPEQPWQKGIYKCTFNPKLEDLAANNLVRLFDSKVSEGQNVVEREFVLSFNIK